MKIEVLMIRDPDTSTEVRLWIDGVETGFASESVDPGAGHEKFSWLGTQVSVLMRDDYSEGFKAAALGAYQSYDDSEYVTDCGGGIEAYCPVCHQPVDDDPDNEDLEVAAATVRQHMKDAHPEK